jgi:hypothetical protein
MEKSSGDPTGKSTEGRKARAGKGRDRDKVKAALQEGSEVKPV